MARITMQLNPFPPKGRALDETFATGGPFSGVGAVKVKLWLSSNRFAG
ncbi:hypothetical protein [Kitasatospora sp. CB02891]|nr:hypothetical protein [Kitasatospora sp. CB02891]